MAATRRTTGNVRRLVRKDRTLQARIPAGLDQELRERADGLGLSVSTLVRNVLLHTFDLVEGIVTDGSGVARAARAESRRESGRSEDGRAGSTGPAGATEATLAWQEVVLNRNAVCESCNAVLTRGTRGAMGVPAGPRPAFICLKCLSGLAPMDSA